MADESEDGEDGEPYDYEGAAVAFLTLRINTPAGEWLSDADLEIVRANWLEAIEVDGAENAAEYSELAMMNIAWYALTNLAALTGKTEQEWLQQIVLDSHSGDRGGRGVLMAEDAWLIDRAFPRNRDLGRRR